MVHNESISVYKYQKAADGYYEFLPAQPLLQTSAPSYATIRQSSGGDVIISERMATSNVFELLCNYRSDFTWTRDMFVVTRLGNLDVTDIKEEPNRERMRLMRLECAYITGVNDTGSGTPSVVGGLTTLYYTVPADAATLTLPAINGKTVYLIFRDGVEKKVVASSPAANEVMVNGSTLSLVTGDIFYSGERITILYA